LLDSPPAVKAFWHWLSSTFGCFRFLSIELPGDAKSLVDILAWEMGNIRRRKEELVQVFMKVGVDNGVNKTNAFLAVRTVRVQQAGGAGSSLSMRGGTLNVDLTISSL